MATKTLIFLLFILFFFFFFGVARTMEQWAHGIAFYTEGAVEIQHPELYEAGNGWYSNNVLTVCGISQLL